MVKFRRLLGYSLAVCAVLIGVLAAGMSFNVRAQYASEALCGGGSATYQIRLYGNTAWTYDAALTKIGGVIDTTGVKTRQKFLVCDSSLSDASTNSVLILIGNSVVYVSSSAGDLAPRNARD